MEVPAISAPLSILVVESVLVVVSVDDILELDELRHSAGGDRGSVSETGNGTGRDRGAEKPGGIDIWNIENQVTVELRLTY